MQVILLEKVVNLGNIGDQVKVTPGYGRNFLIPQKKAAPVTAENIAALELRRAELEKQEAEHLAAAKARAEEICAAKVVIAVKVAEEDKLYGSIGAQELMKAFAEAGVEVAKREFDLPNGPIHSLGEHQVHVRIHSDVELTITVSVVAENE